MRTGRLFRMGFSWAAAVLLLAFAPPAWAGTFTVAGAAGQSVTMNDEIDTLTFTVTNTDNNGYINSVTFTFPSSRYYVEWDTTAPTGWLVNNITSVTTSVTFCVSNGAVNPACSTAVDPDRIAPGASLTFSIRVKGPNWENFVRSASDQTDTLSSVTATGTEGFSISGGLPTWPRRSLAVTLVATPDAVSVGQTITLTMQVENRSTASKASITASPNPPTINLGGGAVVTQTGGPTYSPSPLTLNAGLQGTITYTYRADAAGTVSWSAGATAASATSKTGTSNTVVINPLAVSLSVDPLSVTSGQNVTVTMQVQNPYVGGIGASDTTIPVVSTSGFPAAGILRIDSEQMSYTGTTATSFTGVTRGINGTMAATHSSGSSAWGTSTPLSSGIGAGDTTLPVASTSGFPSAGTLLIDSEQMSYTGTTAASFTGVTRGINGTTAAAHSSGIRVWGIVGSVLVASVTSSVSTTALSSGISVGDTTIPVASTAMFPSAGILRIDNELIRYTGKTAATFTGATRGASGTTAAVHSTGAVVELWSVSFGNIVPTLTSSGTATATLVSGPTPASLASLAPGQTGVFQWVYRITGTVGPPAQTYQFQGSVTADGTYTSNAAQSQQGTISMYSVVVNPTTIATGSANVTISFTVYNGNPAGGNDRIRRIRLYDPNATWAGFYQSSNVSGCAGWTDNPIGGGREFGTTGGGAIPYQGSCTFNVIFSQVPAVTVDTPYAFYLDLYNIPFNFMGTLQAQVTVTAYRLTLTHNPPGPFPADGTCSTTLTATLSGASPLSGRVIVFTTTAGTLSSGTATTNASGAATVTLRAPVSSTAVTASLTATYIKTKGTDSVSYNAYSGANLQYVGGSLSPMAVPMSCARAFSVRVRNLSTSSSATLATATTFTFTGYSANLSAGTTIAAGAEAALTFNSVTTPATAGSYAPTLTFDVAGRDCNNNPTATQTRSVTDPVTVAGPCTGGTIRILDWREVVK